MFYVYVLRCRDGSLYTGYTNDLDKRVKMHGQGKAAKYTRGRLPVELLFNWKFETKTEAMKAEIYFKNLARKQKMQIISAKSPLRMQC